MNFSTGFTCNKLILVSKKDPKPCFHDAKGKNQARRIRTAHKSGLQRTNAAANSSYCCNPTLFYFVRKITSLLRLAYLKKLQWRVQVTAEVKKANPTHTRFIIASLHHRLEHKKINKNLYEHIHHTKICGLHISNPNKCACMLSGENHFIKQAQERSKNKIGV